MTPMSSGSRKWTVCGCWHPEMLRNCAILLLLLIWAPGLRAGELTVFAAASLKTALDEIALLYAKDSGDRLVLVYGASSALSRQIDHGAPADLYISANSAWMDHLADRGRLVPESRRDLLGNRLVLIAGTHTGPVPKIAPGFDLTGALGDGYLSMAMIDAVPAGLYGRAALTRLGIWQDLRGRVAQSDNVRAALRLVALGEAPLGIVYASDARAEPRVRIAGQFAEDLHPRIVYPAAVIRGGNTASAAAFLTYLGGGKASEVFRSQGFLIAGQDK